MMIRRNKIRHIDQIACADAHGLADMDSWIGFSAIWFILWGPGTSVLHVISIHLLPAVWKAISPYTADMHGDTCRCELNEEVTWHLLKQGRVVHVHIVPVHESSLAFSSRTLSATAHWSTAGSINQCAEQSAPSLIQSPFQQNAAIRTTQECVFAPLFMSVWFVCVPVPLAATADPKQKKNPPLHPDVRETEWAEEADRKHYGEECCVKLGFAAVKKRRRSPDMELERWVVCSCYC